MISLCRLFADDTSLGYSSRDTTQIQSVISHDLSELSEWSKKWLMSFNPAKTEIMLFSYIETPEMNFTFNGKRIEVTDFHKHLGVTFSKDAKWNTHVDNIIKNVSKHLNVLRKLKYRISRSNLEKLYLTFIRPLLEYACEVWDNMGVGYCKKLEQLQLEAARIVTGLPIFTSNRIIYDEIGWETLAERRERRKLQLFYNIQHNNAPAYLCNSIPPTIQSTAVYPLRNGNDIIYPFCRLSLTQESFIPSTIRLWNNLNVVTRNIDSLGKFKTELKNLKLNSKAQVPKHYDFGNRKLNIILTQLRCSASFLNYDLNRVNIISDPSCSCGAKFEDSRHFFFYCPKYSNIRTKLFNNLNWLPDNSLLNLNTLTSGDKSLTNVENERIIKNVYEFIKESKRFLIV